MAKTRSMTRNQNHGDETSSSSSTKKRLKTFDKGDVAPWSDLNHNILFLVMMQLGVIDFLAFSLVCKSWRSLALLNKNMFMASKPPMKIRILEDSYCCLEDFEERKFTTILPHSSGRTCFGITCGYLIFFSEETRDFWLVNPMTRHELHFPKYPLYVPYHGDDFRAILVFSPSISGWVFVVSHTTLLGYNEKISYKIAGKRRWNHVSLTLSLPILDLHFFKGKIYTLHTDCSLGELRLEPNRKSKWALLETKKFPQPDLPYPWLISTIEKLYVMNWVSEQKGVMELDFGEMKWVLPEETIKELAIFGGWLNIFVDLKPMSWTGPWTQYKSHCLFPDTGKSRQGMFLYNGMLYFPHDCLNVNHLDE